MRRRARRTMVAIAGALIGISVPFLFPAYQGSPAGLILAGLLGALLASAIFEGFH